MYHLESDYKCLGQGWLALLSWTLNRHCNESIVLSSKRRENVLVLENIAREES